MKILIVDDENLSRKVLASKLKALGSCEAVDNAKEALAKLKAAKEAGRPFDMITLDVSMPGLDGRQMLKHIRQQERKDRVPREKRAKILMVTARMNMNTIKSCIKLGCNGYLTKPVSRLQLLQKLGRMGFDTKDALKSEGKEQSNTAVVADIINRFYSGKIAMPVFPHIVNEVEDLLNGADPSMDDLCKILEKDIVISTKLISIANSPLYKGMDTVDSLNGALLRLGMKTARGVVTAVAAKHFFNTDNASLKTAMDRLWLHSFAVATLAKHLAEAAGIERTENLFLMGIIHDIGKMLLMKAFTDIRPDYSLDDDDLRTAIHEIHTTFGAVLLKRMRFSDNFVQAAEFHHWNRYEKDTDPELLVLSLADHLARELGFEFMDYRWQTGQTDAGGDAGKNKGGKADMDREAVLKRISELSAIQHLGLTPEIILTIGEQVKPAIEESARAF